MIVANFIISAAALWMGDAWPVYWIWQKCLMLLGGIYWPLTFYPQWFQKIAYLSPFPAMMAIPANLAFGFSDQWFRDILIQILWLGVIMSFSAFIGRLVRNFFKASGEAY